MFSRQPWALKFECLLGKKDRTFEDRKFILASDMKLQGVSLLLQYGILIHLVNALDDG